MVGWLQELTARWHPYLHHLSQHQPFLHVYSTILSIRSAVPGRLNSIFCGMVPRRWIAGKHALSESLCLWTYSVLCRACQSIQARDHHPAALSRHGALMNSWVSRSTRVACAHCCRALHRVASHTLRCCADRIVRFRSSHVFIQSNTAEIKALYQNQRSWRAEGQDENVARHRSMHSR